MLFASGPIRLVGGGVGPVRVLYATGPIRLVGGGVGPVGVLSASRPAIEDMNSKLYVRIIK